MTAPGDERVSTTVASQRARGAARRPTAQLALMQPRSARGLTTETTPSCDGGSGSTRRAFAAGASNGGITTRRSAAECTRESGQNGFSGPQAANGTSRTLNGRRSGAAAAAHAGWEPHADEGMDVDSDKDGSSSGGGSPEAALANGGAGEDVGALQQRIQQATALTTHFETRERELLLPPPSPPVKRGRGRPRKNPLPVSPEFTAAAAAVAAAAAAAATAAAAAVASAGEPSPTESVGSDGFSARYGGENASSGASSGEKRLARDSRGRGRPRKGTSPSAAAAAAAFDRNGGGFAGGGGGGGGGSGGSGNVVSRSSNEAAQVGRRGDAPMDEGSGSGSNGAARRGRKRKLPSSDGGAESGGGRPAPPALPASQSAWEGGLRDENAEAAAAGRGAAADSNRRGGATRGVAAVRNGRESPGNNADDGSVIDEPPLSESGASRTLADGDNNNNNSNCDDARGEDEGDALANATAAAGAAEKEEEAEEDLSEWREPPLGAGEELMRPANAATLVLAASVVQSLAGGPKTDAELRQSAHRDLEGCRPFIPTLGTAPLSADALDVRLAGDVLQALGLAVSESTELSDAAVDNCSCAELQAPGAELGGQPANCVCRKIVSYVTSILGPDVGKTLSQNSKARPPARAPSPKPSPAVWPTDSGSALAPKSAERKRADAFSPEIPASDAAEPCAPVTTEALAATLAAAADAPALGLLLATKLNGMAIWEWGGINWDDPAAAAATTAAAESGGGGGGGSAVDTMVDSAHADAARSGLASAAADALRQAKTLLRKGVWDPQRTQALRGAMLLPDEAAVDVSEALPPAMDEDAAVADVHALGFGPSSEFDDVPGFPIEVTSPVEMGSSEALAAAVGSLGVAYPAAEAAAGEAAGAVAAAEAGAAATAAEAAAVAEATAAEAAAGAAAEEAAAAGTEAAAEGAAALAAAEAATAGIAANAETGASLVAVGDTGTKAAAVGTEPGVVTAKPAPTEVSEEAGGQPAAGHASAVEGGEGSAAAAPAEGGESSAVAAAVVTPAAAAAAEPAATGTNAGDGADAFGPELAPANDVTADASSPTPAAWDERDVTVELQTSEGAAAAAAAAPAFAALGSSSDGSRHITAMDVVETEDRVPGSAQEGENAAAHTDPTALDLPGDHEDLLQGPLTAGGSESGWADEQAGQEGESGGGGNASLTLASLASETSLHNVFSDVQLSASPSAWSASAAAAAAAAATAAAATGAAPAATIRRNHLPGFGLRSGGASSSHVEGQETEAYAFNYDAPVPLHAADGTANRKSSSSSGGGLDLQSFASEDVSRIGAADPAGSDSSTTSNNAALAAAAAAAAAASNGNNTNELASPLQARRGQPPTPWIGAADEVIATAALKSPFLANPLVRGAPIALRTALAGWLKAAESARNAAGGALGSNHTIAEAGSVPPSSASEKSGGVAAAAAAAAAAGSSSGATPVALPPHARHLAEEGLFDVIELVWGSHRLEEAYTYLADASTGLPINPEAFRLAMDGECYPGSQLERKFGRAVQEAMLLWLYNKSSEWMEWRDREDRIQMGLLAAPNAAGAATSSSDPKGAAGSTSISTGAAESNRRARNPRLRLDPKQDTILPRWRFHAKRLAGLEVDAWRTQLREETLMRELCRRCGVVLPPGFTRAEALRRLRLRMDPSSSASGARSGRYYNGRGGGASAGGPNGSRARFTPGLTAMALLKRAGIKEPPREALVVAASAAAVAAAEAASSAAAAANGAGNDSDTESCPRVRRKLSHPGRTSSSDLGVAKVLPHAVPPLDIRPRIARGPSALSSRKRSRGGSFASFSAPDLLRPSEGRSTPRPRYDEEDEFASAGSGSSALTAAALSNREWGKSGIDDCMIVTRATAWEEVSRQFVPVQDLSSAMNAMPRQNSSDPDWEESMELPRGGKPIRRGSSIGIGPGGEIVAPTFRVLDPEDRGKIPEGESDGEEDISDEAYIKRHTVHLERMREKMEAARKAREALASPRQPSSTRNKKARPWGDSRSNQPTPQGSPATPRSCSSATAVGEAKGWAFAAAAIGFRGGANATTLDRSNSNSAVGVAAPAGENALPPEGSAGGASATPRGLTVSRSRSGSGGGGGLGLCQGGASYIEPPAPVQRSSSPDAIVAGGGGEGGRSDLPVVDSVVAASPLNKRARPMIGPGSTLSSPASASAAAAGSDDLATGSGLELKSAEAQSAAAAAAAAAAADAATGFVAEVGNTVAAPAADEGISAAAPAKAAGAESGRKLRRKSVVA